MCDSPALRHADYGGCVADCPVVLRDGVGGGDADSHVFRCEGACDGAGGGGADARVARERDAAGDGGAGPQTVVGAVLLPAPPGCYSRVQPRVVDTETFGSRCCRRRVSMSLVPRRQHSDDRVRRLRPGSRVARPRPRRHQRHRRRSNQERTKDLPVVPYRSVHFVGRRKQ